MVVNLSGGDEVGDRDDCDRGRFVVDHNIRDKYFFLVKRDKYFYE